MAASKADERWLACLDRAIALVNAEVATGRLVLDAEQRAVAIAKVFYDELPSRRVPS